MFKISLIPILALALAVLLASDDFPNQAPPGAGPERTALIGTQCSGIVNFADIFCTAAGVARTAS